MCEFGTLFRKTAVFAPRAAARKGGAKAKLLKMIFGRLRPKIIARGAKPAVFPEKLPETLNFKEKNRKHFAGVAFLRRLCYDEIVIQDIFDDKG